ncbi:hypothetical protein VV02_02350 [Luteipulveratus mongoliensis]|uniref:Carbohydrate kinase PfkB domain-containing protein n=1 Tax=Luteipulveratus mongoliensis TaxID=571913 RepID=A0A0K1JEG0_9MICO|nr:hypothetical protein VV02_02350 [Luteipulveratus mongoliensis]
MILTLTPNPALDVTYTVDALEPGASHRVRQVVQRAGGKGVNAASVLAQLGHPVRAYGPAGGPTGALLIDDLRRRGIDQAMTEVSANTRRTITVVAESDHSATVLNEPGTLDAVSWRQVLADLRHGLEAGAEVLVASGSLPAGVADEAYADVIGLAHEHGCPCIVDTSGPALLSALAASPDLIKPNHHELAEVTGTSEAYDGARLLQQRGARTVVVSRGENGLLLVRPDGTSYAARPRVPLEGNPTGAGDAAVAALAAGLSLNLSEPEMVRTAVGWSSAAVLAPVAGDVDRAALHDLTTTVIQGDA